MPVSFEHVLWFSVFQRPYIDQVGWIPAISLNSPKPSASGDEASISRYRDTLERNVLLEKLGLLRGRATKQVGPVEVPQVLLSFARTLCLEKLPRQRNGAFVQGVLSQVHADYVELPPGSLSLRARLVALLPGIGRDPRDHEWDEHGDRTYNDEQVVAPPTFLAP